MTKLTLADEYNVALARPKQGLAFYKVNFDHDKMFKSKASGAIADEKMRMRKSTRFYIDDELLHWVYNMADNISVDRLNAAMQTAIPPFDEMWIEWDEDKRMEYTKEKYPSFKPEGTSPMVGYVISKVRSSDNVYQFSSVFKVKDEDDEIGNTIMKVPLSILVNFDSMFEKELRPFAQAHSANENMNELAYLQMIWGANWVKEHGSHIPIIMENLNKRTTLVANGAMDWINPGVLSRDFNNHIMGESMYEKFVEPYAEMIHGDLRYLMIMLGVLNYDWIQKSPIQRVGKGKHWKFSHQHPFVEYRTLKLDLPKPRGVEMRDKVFTASISVPRRHHEVRGHWRLYKKTNTRVWIKSHGRGDKSVGVIHKDYELTRARGA